MKVDLLLICSTMAVAFAARPLLQSAAREV